MAEGEVLDLAAGKVVPDGGNVELHDILIFVILPFLVVFRGHDVELRAAEGDTDVR